MPKSQAVLTLNSYNYGAWSMRSWLMCRLVGLEFTERMVAPDDPSSRAELLQLSPSFLVPFLESDGVRVWDTLAIGEYLQETVPGARLLPEEAGRRAHCRSISAELHSGFQSLRSALPLNIRRRQPEFKVWAGAEPDIQRVSAIWSECLTRYKGPWLFGDRPTLADAMYAPECIRFRNYGIDLDPACARYVKTVIGCPEVAEWVDRAEKEPETLTQLEGEF